MPEIVPRPIKTNLAGSWVDRHGRNIWQDVNGEIGEAGLWYFLDNNGRKTRPVQTGRGYDFSIAGQKLTSQGTINGIYEFEILASFSQFNTNNFVLDGTSVTPGKKTLNIRQTQVVWSNQNFGSFVWAIPALELNKIYFFETKLLSGGSGVTLALYVNGVYYGDQNLAGYGLANITYQLSGVGGASGNWFYGKLYSLKLKNNFGATLAWLSCEETNGLVAFSNDSTKPNWDINLNGGSESGFHIPSNQVPSRANEVGHGKGGHFDTTRYLQLSELADFRQQSMTITAKIQYSGDSFLGGNYIQTLGSNYGGWTWYIDGNDKLSVNVYSGNSIGISVHTYSTAFQVGGIYDIKLQFDNTTKVILGVNGTDESFTASFPVGYTNNEKHFIAARLDTNDGSFKNLWRGVMYQYREYDDANNKELTNLQWGAGTTLIVPNVGADAPTDTDAQWVNSSGYSIVPLNEADPAKDVLGIELPFNYRGRVNLPTQIKDSSVGNFDGVLVLSFSDLTGRSIVAQSGTVTVQISGNNIIPVSGTGQLYYLEFDNGSNYIFGEREGLIVHDRNITNKLNGTFVLGGSAYGSQFSTSNFQRPYALEEGFNRAAYFAGLRYLNLGDHTELKIDTFEIEIIFRSGADSTPEVLYGNYQNTELDGILISKNAVNKLVLFWGKTGLDFGSAEMTNDIPLNTYLKLSLKVYGNNAYFNLSGDIETVPLVDYNVGWSTVTDTTIGAQPSGEFINTQSIYGTKFWELDSSGNRIKELINIDYVNGDKTLISNIANNAPSGSNALWIAGEGVYILIPADPASPRFDVNGNKLGIKGNGKSILPNTGNKYARNEFNAPMLYALNILQGENKSYEYFQTREAFSDTAEENRTSKLLAYDEFPEPMAGSGSNFDGLITSQSNIPKTDTDFIHGSGRFRIFVLASFVDNTSTTDFKFLLGTTSLLATPAFGFRIEYGNRVVGFEGNIQIFYGISSTTRVQSGDVSSILEDGNLHLIEFRSEASQVSILIDQQIVYQLGSGLPGVSPTTSDDQLWIGKGATSASNHKGLIALAAIYDQYNNEPVFFPFQEDSGLRWYNVGRQRSAYTWAVISLNGAANNTQFQANANIQYLHNYLYGNTYGGYFDGVIAGKFSEPTNVDTNWHIQGFKLEAKIICEVEVSTDIIFSNGKYTAATQYGFQIARESTTDKLAIIINGQALLSTATIPINSVKDIVVKKKPASTTVTVIIEGVEENLIFSTGTINYDLTANSITCGVRYNYDTPAYDLNFNGVIKKLRLTEINDNEDEVKELINNDWLNNNGTIVPNTGAQKPTGSDMTWIGGTGQTGIIPGDRDGSEKDVQGDTIDNVEVRRKYLRINNYLRRKDYLETLL